MTGQEPEQTKGTWVTYRPEIKILDCTIRDGGLITDHQFKDDLVNAVFETGIAAGIDYFEFGYKASKKIYAPDTFGTWKYCNEDDIRSVVGDRQGQIKISVMADAERTDYHEDILPKEDSVIDCIRIASYIHQIPAAIDMIKDAHDKGYETLMQLMAVSTINEQDVMEALEIVAEHPLAEIPAVQ